MSSTRSLAAKGSTTAVMLARMARWPRRTPDPTTVRFGQCLNDLRQETGLSQMEWASKHDFDRTFLGYLEVGSRSPTIVTLARLAKFDMTIAELVDGIDE